MNLFLVSYDLRKPGKDYDSLYKSLKTAINWWHYLDSTWILATNETIESWSNKIQANIDENDFFIIIDIAGRGKLSQGWLPRKAWDWIRHHDS